MEPVVNDRLDSDSARLKAEQFDKTATWEQGRVDKKHHFGVTGMIIVSHRGQPHR